MDVLGIHVPSTSPVFLAVLAVHVAAALVAVGSGAGAMVVRRKGPGRHTALGGVYFTALGVVAATAVVLAGMRLREDYHLALLGVLAFALAATGRAARRRAWSRRRSHPHWSHRHWSGDGVHISAMGASYVVMLTAFYVDNGHQLPVWDRLPTIALWLLPSIVGAPLIWRATRHARHARRTSHDHATTAAGQW